MIGPKQRTILRAIESEPMPSFAFDEQNIIHGIVKDGLAIIIGDDLSITASGLDALEEVCEYQKNWAAKRRTAANGNGSHDDHIVEANEMVGHFTDADNMVADVNVKMERVETLLWVNQETGEIVDSSHPPSSNSTCDDKCLNCEVLELLLERNPSVSQLVEQVRQRRENDAAINRILQTLGGAK